MNITVENILNFIIDKRENVLCDEAKQGQLEAFNQVIDFILGKGE